MVQQDDLGEALPHGAAKRRQEKDKAERGGPRRAHVPKQSAKSGPLPCGPRRRRHGRKTSGPAAQTKDSRHTRPLGEHPFRERPIENTRGRNHPPDGATVSRCNMWSRKIQIKCSTKKRSGPLLISAK